MKAIDNFVLQWADNGNATYSQQECTLLTRDQRPYGYDCPHWRWQWIMDHRWVLPGPGALHDPDPCHFPHGIPRDQVIVELLIPYFQQPRFKGYLEIASDDEFWAVRKAVNVSGKRMNNNMVSAHVLETGMLLGRPRGFLEPGATHMPPQVQVLYELLFFDIREILGDREALIRQVFVPNFPEIVIEKQLFVESLLAYIFGEKEYQRRNALRPTASASEFGRHFNRQLDYLACLRDLGISNEKDIHNLLRRVLEYGDQLRHRKSNPPISDAAVIAQFQEKRVRTEKLAGKIPSTWSASDR